ncbi:MAG TPA: hypothetical protein VGJ21_16220 [Terracidiphilus sp.]|jgi:hypothetical protein
MTHSIDNAKLDGSHAQGRKIFGFPLRGFGLFSSLLLSFASALFTFCIATMVAIFALLFYRQNGHAGVDMAISYRDIGFPASMVVLAIALPFFLTLWVRAKINQ